MRDPVAAPPRSACAILRATLATAPPSPHHRPPPFPFRQRTSSPIERSLRPLTTAEPARTRPAGRDRGHRGLLGTLQFDRPMRRAPRARFQDHGHREKSLADFEEAIRTQPGDGTSYAARGAYYAAANEPVRALSRLRDSHQSEGAAHRSLYRPGQRPAGHRPAPGGPCPAKAIKLRVDNPQPYKGRAWPLAALGKVSRRHRRFRCLPQLPAGLRTGFCWERALAYSALREHRRAQEDLSGALALVARTICAPCAARAVRERLGDDQGALADYDEAIRRDPADARLYLVRGALYARLEPKPGSASGFRGSNRTACSRS